MGFQGLLGAVARQFVSNVNPALVYPCYSGPYSADVLLQNISDHRASVFNRVLTSWRTATEALKNGKAADCPFEVIMTTDALNSFSGEQIEALNEAKQAYSDALRDSRNAQMNQEKLSAIRLADTIAGLCKEIAHSQKENGPTGLSTKRETDAYKKLYAAISEGITYHSHFGPPIRSMRGFVEKKRGHKITFLSLAASALDRGARMTLFDSRAYRDCFAAFEDEARFTGMSLGFSYKGHQDKKPSEPPRMKKDSIVL